MTHDFTAKAVKRAKQQLVAQDRRANWKRDFSGASGYADDALIEELVEESHRRTPVELTHTI